MTILKIFELEKSPKGELFVQIKFFLLWKDHPTNCMKAISLYQEIDSFFLANPSKRYIDPKMDVWAFRL